MLKKKKKMSFKYSFSAAYTLKAVQIMYKIGIKSQYASRTASAYAKSQGVC